LKRSVKLNFKGVELTCKPGSVKDNHSSRPCVTTRLKQPTQVQCGHTIEPLFGLAPEGVCSAINVTIYAVRSYHTFSPLPKKLGGIFSVALSVGSRPPGVTWHLALRSPDFPL